MTLKDAIEAKTYSLGGVDFTVVVVDRGVCETMLAAARDMLALGEARKELPKGHTPKKKNPHTPIYNKKKLTTFNITTTNPTQKWG